MKSFSILFITLFLTSSIYSQGGMEYKVDYKANFNKGFKNARNKYTGGKQFKRIKLLGIDNSPCLMAECPIGPRKETATLFLNAYSLSLFVDPVLSVSYAIVNAEKNAPAPTLTIRAEETHHGFTQWITGIPKSITGPSTTDFSLPLDAENISWQTITVSVAELQAYDDYIMIDANFTGGGWVLIDDIKIIGTKTRIKKEDCSKKFSSYNEFLNYEEIPNALDYRLTFKPIPSGSGEEIKYTTGNTKTRVKLSEIEGLKANTSYKVTVTKILLAPSYHRYLPSTSHYTNYGSPCRITTPDSNGTAITSNDCGKKFDNYDELLNYYKVPNAQNYQLRFTNVSSGEKTRYTRGSSETSTKLNEIVGLQDNSTYNVKVRAMVNGSFQPYASSCQITTPSTAIAHRIGNSEDELTTFNSHSSTKLDIDIYPNPTEGNSIRLALNGLQDNTALVVSDVSGKIIHEQKISHDAENNYNGIIEFNEKLNAGFYLITIVSNNNRVTKQLVVR